MRVGATGLYAVASVTELHSGAEDSDFQNIRICDAWGIIDCKRELEIGMIERKNVPV